MKKEIRTFPSGLQQEGWNLFPDDPHQNYFLYQDAHTCHLVVDMKSGRQINRSLETILELSPMEIVDLFFK